MRARGFGIVIGLLVAGGFAAAGWQLLRLLSVGGGPGRIAAGVVGCLIAAGAILIPVCSGLIPDTDHSQRIRERRKDRVGRFHADGPPRKEPSGGDRRNGGGR